MQTKREKKLRFDEMLLPIHTDYHAKACDFYVDSAILERLNNWPGWDYLSSDICTGQAYKFVIEGT